MTNLEKFRNMTEEELVDFIDEPLDFFNCNKCGKPWEDRKIHACEDCKEWIREFLKRDE